MIKHVPELDDGVAGILSHKQMEHSHQLATEANIEPAQLPLEIWHLGGLMPKGPE